MDLFAYAQIGELEAIAKANGIEVRRLRGLRLMGWEEVLTEEDWKRVLHDAKINAYELVLQAEPPFALDPLCFAYDSHSRRMKRYLIVRRWTETITNESHPEGYTVERQETVGIRWDRLHGNKRKAVKYYVKHKTRMTIRQYKLWDQYAGRKDVLYIHAKIGSTAWSDARWWDYEKEPWFLGACDDAFDPAYCDIYAKIDPLTIEAA